MLKIHNSPIALVSLAAGRGTRMRNELRGPKPLALFGDEPLLQRTLRQFHEIGVQLMLVVTGYEADQVGAAALSVSPDIHLIYNDRYEEDRNIYSLLLALRKIPDHFGILLIEGDVVLTDKTIMRIASLPLTDRSIWTACGHFQSGQSGGIILPEADGRIQEIRYSAWDDSLAKWYKNLGLIYIAPEQVPVYRKYLETYAASSLDYYFMTPWQEHLDSLPAYLLDVGCHGGTAFNTPEEYKVAQELVCQDVLEEADVILYEVDKLRHIENYDPNRVSWLANKIMTEHLWTAPLAVSQEHDLVMDGQHRMEAARQLGLRFVPVVFFDYDRIPVYSLRPGYKVTGSEIVARALSGDIYPYKTAKHILPTIPRCHISLEDLY